MGLKNLIRGQCLSSISYRAADAQELAQVFDRENHRIMYQSILTVQPGQSAVLVNEGTIADIFEPGRYELTTENMPVVTALNEWKYGFNETFIVETVFVNTNEIIDVPWGTSEKLTIQDNIFGLVNLGANGRYSFAVTDARAFVEQLLGTKLRYTAAELRPFLTSQIAMLFKEIVTEKPMNFLDIQGYAYEASEELKARLGGLLKTYGLEVRNMNLQIALPDNVLKAIDERAAMGAIGGMDAYAFKKQVDAQAEAMVSMAKNESAGGMNSMAGMGMQMSAGMMMGQAMAGQMGAAKPQNPNAPVQSQNTDNPQPAQQVGNGPKFCSQCGAKVVPGSKFCPECGTKLV